MIITDLQEVTKVKTKVFIDGEFAFVLYKGELKTYRIQEQEELSEEVYHQILDEVLTKRAKLRCMYLLQKRDYTQYGLADKLKREYYPQEIIDRALTYVSAYGYVDDVRYAKAYIQYACGAKSRKQIEFDLMKKGVAKEDMAAAFLQLDEMQELASEEGLMRKLLVKKHYKSEEATLEERRKIIGFLYRKGFSLDKIYKVVGECE